MPAGEPSRTKLTGYLQANAGGSSRHQSDLQDTESEGCQHVLTDTVCLLERRIIYTF